MSLIYSYKFQSQRYKSWKGTSTNSIVPGNSRGGVNGTSDKSNDFIGPSFKARPIKHYRKKLLPNLNSGSSKATIKHVIDNPGGKVYLGADANNAWCNSNNTSVKINNLISTDKNTKIYTNDDDKFFDSDDCNVYPYRCNGNNKPVCVSCNPENNIIKTAKTKLDKKYFTNTKSYLHSRCKRYNQNISISKRKGNKYIGTNGNILWPSDSANGSQVFNTLNCIKGCETCYTCSEITDKSTTIYKPSNVQFSKQGAVSSGLLSLKKRYDTINKNKAFS